MTSLFLGESVTSLGGGCFSGCSGISDVKFPESLESIEAETFYGCVGLKAIVISKNVKSIGVCAFAECTGLKEVEFNADNCERCGSNSKNGAFPPELSKVTFGENVTNIPDYAFYNCKGITEITIPKSINKIGEDAFYGTGLEKLYYNSVYCETLSSFPASLTSVIIGDAVRKLNGYIFSDCENLKAVYISDLESWCSNTELTISKSNPLYYAHSLYYNGEKLEHLEIPSTISKIGQFQFVNCSDLKSIVIPESVEEIGYNAFDGCTGVRDFYLYHETPISIGYYDFASFRQYATVHVPKGALDNYKEDMYWSRFYDIVDDLEPAGIDENIKDENGKIEIYDMRGVKLYSGDKESCRKLPSGCYIMVKGTETTRIYIR